MAFRFIIAVAIAVLSLSPVSGQGLMDSVLGSGGLGLWGGGPQQSVLESFNSPEFYGAPMGSPGSYSAGPYRNQAPQGGGQPQGNYQSQPSMTAQNYYHPNVYSNGRGLYPDWYDVQPRANPSGQANNQQSVNQTYETGPQTMNPQRANPGNRPNNPNQPQQGQMAPNNPGPDLSNNPEDLPPGAVKIVTTTPEGTTVQVYTPHGTNYQPPNAAQNMRPATAPTRPSARNFAPAQQNQDGAPTVNTGEGRIARPTPSSAPPHQDPRQGWGYSSNPNRPKNPFSR